MSLNYLLNIVSPASVSSKYTLHFSSKLFYHKESTTTLTLQISSKKNLVFILLKLTSFEAFVLIA